MTTEIINPPNLEHGFVTGRFVEAIADTMDDEDRYPDLRAIAGDIEFRPRQVVHLYGGVYPATVVKKPIVVPVDRQGFLVDVASENSSSIPRGVYLAIGQYEVRPRFPNASEVNSFIITVTTEHTLANPLDLTESAPISPPPGTVPVVTDETRIRAENAAAESEQYRDQSRGYSETAAQIAQNISSISDEVEEVRGLATEAEGYANAAETSSQSAQQAISGIDDLIAQAQGHADDASGFANTAQGYSETSAQEAAAANNFANSGQVHADNASGYANDASSSATTAETEATRSASEATRAQGIADGISTDLSGYVAYKGDLGSTNIDNVRDPGLYVQSDRLNVTPENGYPAETSLNAGSLEVRPFGTNSNWKIQIWTEWNTRRVWMRSTSNGSSWTTIWREMASIYQVEQMISSIPNELASDSDSVGSFLVSGGGTSIYRRSPRSRISEVYSSGLRAGITGTIDLVRENSLTMINLALTRNSSVALDSYASSGDESVYLFNLPTSPSFIAQFGAMVLGTFGGINYNTRSVCQVMVVGNSIVAYGNGISNSNWTRLNASGILLPAGFLQANGGVNWFGQSVAEQYF